MGNNWSTKNKILAGLWSGAFAVIVILGISSSIETLNQRKEYARVIDSTYYAKKDSLENWYQFQLDSLKRDYLARKNLENLAR